MNRTLTGATALLLVMLVAAPARAQTPLVVGAVRDQRGVPIAGASVLGRRATSGPLSTSTDTAGTFSLAGEGVEEISVTCRYCAPAVVAVRPGEPVVVIVRRYEALEAEAPTTADLESLPYAGVESAAALRPFSLLSQSSTAYPGPRLSDRGLSPNGSLLVDDGTPNYDVVGGASPYDFIPAQFQRTATMQSASNAYLYGDQAAGGIAIDDPTANGDPNWQVATLGSDVIGRAQVGSDALGGVFGSISNDLQSRQRVDLSANLSPGADQSLDLAAGTEQGRNFVAPPSQFAGSFSFANATYSNPQLANLYVAAVLDRGGYVYQDGYPTLTNWSDSGVSLGVRSNAPISTFADFGIRTSSGLFDPHGTGWEALPVIGATLNQTRADAGVRASGEDYDVTAGVGTFWIGYSGGASGLAQPLRTALAVPSLQAQLFPNSRWSVDLDGSGSFNLPTFIEEYSYGYAAPTSIDYQRYELFSGMLSYTDLSRLRVSFEEATQRVTGEAQGRVTSAGLAAAWQIAPALSLRAWAMHVTDNAVPYASSAYGVAPAPTVNAFWLTYEDKPDAVRIDAIYRRDLLDGSPFYHFDGDISGPVVNQLRWYAGAEDRLRRTFVDVGLRF